MKSTYITALLLTALLGLSACAPQTEAGGTVGGTTGGAADDMANSAASSEAAEGPNLLQNSSFNREDGWGAYFLEAAQGESSFSYGELCLDIESAGDAVWNSQVVQGGLSLRSGERYTLSFNAYANKPVQIRAALEEDGNDYTSLSEQMFALTNNRTDYTLAAEVTESANEGRVSLSTGGEFASAAPVTICLDDVELRASN